MGRLNWFAARSRRPRVLHGWYALAVLCLPGAAWAVPGTVTGVTATVISSQQVNLGWTAVATATKYNIYRCSGSASCTPSTTVFATSTTTSYSNTGLTSSTIYRYNLKAVDASNAVSASFSSIVTGTTPAVAAPTALSATVVSSAQINVSWAASTGTVTGYRIERCTGSTCTTFAQVGTTTTALTFNNTGLTAATTYRFRVRANDAAGNLSAYTSIVNATTLTADTTAPTQPTGLTATAGSATQVNLSWTASTDAVGVTGYRIERCTGATCTTYAQIGTTTTAVTYSDTGLTATTTYRYRVRATDAAGNLSAYSSVVNATTLTADTTAPTAPTNPAAAATSTTQINVTWTASTDNVGVIGYRIERCTGASCTTFAQIATPASSPFADSGLTAATTYRYRIRAADAAGNLSAYSGIVNATTVTPDTQVPTAPTGLTATVVSSTQVSVGWTASTDNVGVTGYLIERCLGAGCSSFTQVATQATTSYSDTGLVASTSYSYRIRATDAAANLSSYSATASVVTGVGLSTFTYDNFKHLMTVQKAGGGTVQYGYDAAGNLTSIQASP